MKTAKTIKAWNVLLALFTAILFSGCGTSGSGGSHETADAQSGQSHPVIFVPVIILPPTDDPAGSGRSSPPEGNPPAQSIRNQQTHPLPLPAEL